MYFSITSQTLKFYILCGTLTRFQLHLSDFAHLGRRTIILMFDRTSPTFLPHFLPTLCGSQSGDVQQPRTASPRYHNTIVLLPSPQWKSLQHPGPICITFFVLRHNFEGPASLGFQRQRGWCPPWHTDFSSEKNTSVRSWNWWCAGNSTLGMSTGVCSPPDTLRPKQVQVLQGNMKLTLFRATHVIPEIPEAE